MAAGRDEICLWIADLATAIIVDALDLKDVQSRAASAQILEQSEFSLEAMSLVRIVAESAKDVAAFRKLALPASVQAGETRDAMLVLLAQALAISGARVIWSNRPQARQARTDVAVAGDAGLAVATKLGGDGAALYTWLSALVAMSCRMISDAAANATPIVRVETGLSMPSTVLAYHLYGDASRAQAVVDISGAATPLIMPAGFDALAS